MAQGIYDSEDGLTTEKEIRCNLLSYGYECECCNECVCKGGGDV